MKERASLPPQDLTLAEIRTLRARQRLYFRDQSYNDKFKVRWCKAYKRAEECTAHCNWSPEAPGCGTTNLTLLQCGGNLQAKLWLGVQGSCLTAGPLVKSAHGAGSQ